MISTAEASGTRCLLLSLHYTPHILLMLFRGEMTDSAALEESDGAPLPPPESHRCLPPNVPRVRSVWEPSCGGIWIVSSLSSRGSIVVGASDEATAREALVVTRLPCSLPALG